MPMPVGHILPYPIATRSYQTLDVATNRPELPHTLPHSLPGVPRRMAYHRLECSVEKSITMDAGIQMRNIREGKFAPKELVIHNVLAQR